MLYNKKMSSIADAAYLGNSYGQTYNSAAQFDVLTTSELDVAGNLVVDGQINGGMRSGFVTGYISAQMLDDLANGANSRALRTTSGAADISSSGAFASLTDTEKASLLTLPVGAMPTGALLCKTGSTAFASLSGALLSIEVTNAYNPATAVTSTTDDIGSVFVDTPLTDLNATTTVAGSDTGPLVAIVPGTSVSLGDTGQVGGLTGYSGGTDGSNTVVASLSGADYTAGATDELKIRINYIIVPNSTEFLSNDY